MLFLSVRGFLDYAGPTVHSRFVWAAVLPSSYSEWSRHPDLRAFRSSIAPPTDASIYASRNTSRCPPQESRPGWIRYFLSRSRASGRRRKALNAAEDFSLRFETRIRSAKDWMRSRKLMINEVLLLFALCGWKMGISTA